MTKLLLALTLLSIGSAAQAFELTGKPLGTNGSNEEYYSVPQYLPYYPTSAPIWPRVVEVQCDETKSGTLQCDGYNWTPAMGRGEYLFVVPKIRPKNATVIENLPTGN